MNLSTGNINIPFFIPKRNQSNVLSMQIGHVDPGLYLNFDEDEFYEVTEEHIGRIWFTVSFATNSGTLELTVIKARNLYNKSRRYTTQQCSSFVTVEMIPFFKSKTIQTKIRKNTSNPDYNEVFTFEISNEFIRKCALHFTVVDMCDDKRQKVIGHAYYPLKELPENNTKDVSMWRNLTANPRPLESGVATGLIHLALHHYENLERMTITVYDIEHLSDADVGSDIFIKLRLFLGESKLETKRSSNLCVENDKKIHLNQSFQFKVTRRDLRLVVIDMGIWLIGHQGIKDRQIGTLRLSSEVSDVKASELWKEMCEASDPVSKWLAILPCD